MYVYSCHLNPIVVNETSILWAKLQGNADNRFYATRYDYLCIAKAMLDD